MAGDKNHLRVPLSHKQSSLLAVVAAVQLLFSCVLPTALTDRLTPRDTNNTSGATRNAEQNNTTPLLNAPTWVLNVPRSQGELVIVGEGRSADKEDALERAWYSALLRIGMTEFPELTKLNTRSQETLKGTSYDRRAVTDLQYINWAGIREARDQGSPYVVENDGTYLVYRLLRWSNEDVSMAHQSVEAALKAKSEASTYTIPDTPESQAADEEVAVTALQKIRKLNRSIKQKDNNFRQIMEEVQCGTKIGDLIKILGEPDRKSEYATPQEYIWGTYSVTSFKSDAGATYSVEENLGQGKKRLVCSP